MVLDCALEVGFLGVLGGMVVSAMLFGGFGIFLRGRRVYFSQDSVGCVLKNFRDCGICSFSERFFKNDRQAERRLPPYTYIYMFTLVHIDI